MTKEKYETGEKYVIPRFYFCIVITVWPFILSQDLTWREICFNKPNAPFSPDCSLFIEKMNLTKKIKNFFFVLTNENNA